MFIYQGWSIWFIGNDLSHRSTYTIAVYEYSMISDFCVVVHGNPAFEHAFLRNTLGILHLPISSTSIDDARETYMTKEHQVERILRSLLPLVWSVSDSVSISETSANRQKKKFDV